MGSQRVRAELYAHVAQSAESHHADFLPLSDAPMAHGRVRRDAGAEQRCGSSQVQVRGDLQHKALINHDRIGIAAIGDASQVLVRGVVSERPLRAELFEAGLTLRAGAIGIDHAADRAEVPRLEAFDRRAHLGDAADDLMAGDARVHGGHDADPFIARLMEIGVADPAE